MIELTNTLIEIETTSGITVIQRSNFENWLEKTGALSYSQDFEIMGEHHQVDGSYTLDEYWQLPDSVIEKDILKFLKIGRAHV